MSKKLHELLAVENNLKGQVETTRSDLVNTFEKKKHHFSEKVVTYQPNEEGAPAVTEEQLDLQTTIRGELAWIAEIWANAINVTSQIAEANTRAKADVVLEDGTVLLANVPATMLLDLEKRLTEIHTFVSAIPTLDPAKGFQPDESRGQHIFRAREEVRVRTKKSQRPLVLAPATKEHPAQVQLISEDLPIGKIRTQEWSGLITTAEKGEMLYRVETVRRAVKQARARANETPVTPDLKFGTVLLQYLFR